MKVATIVPTRFLEFTADSDYHMCLAHLIGKDPEYTGFFKAIGNNPSKYLIMDNGVIEGNCRPIEEIVRKALMVNANEIILPDVYLDAEKTLELSYSALKYVQGNFPLKIMVVPQGKTLDEWLNCAVAMLDWDIDCIGVPKNLTKSLGHAHARTEVLTHLGNKLRGMEVHFLGCWDDPLEILRANQMVRNGLIPPIRGVDSAIPYVFAKAGLLIGEQERPMNGPINFSDRWCDVDILQENIKMWQDAGDSKTIDRLS